MPTPTTYANICMQLTVQGNGRNDRLQFQPLTPSTFSTYAPPGALTQTSPAKMTKVRLKGGALGVTTTQIVPAQFGGLPLYYVILVPPVGSTNLKTLAGATSDVGVPLRADWPLIFANPTPNGPWPTIYVAANSDEVCDLWLI